VRLSEYARQLLNSLNTSLQCFLNTAAVLPAASVQVDMLLRLAVWLSGNALASINVLVLRQTRLVPGWVTVCGWVYHVGM